MKLLPNSFITNHTKDPIVDLHSEQEVFDSKMDGEYLNYYMNYILSGESPVQQLKTYFMGRDETEDEKILIINEILKVLNNLDINAPQNAKIVKNLNDVNKYFNSKAGSFLILNYPIQAKRRINFEWVVLQAIVNPVFSFDDNNVYKREWNRIAQYYTKGFGKEK